MRASIVVLTYNQLEDGTRPCVESIFRHTRKEDFELILVDNASADGTPDYLRQVEKGHDNIKLVLNDRNKGYAGGNNDGMRIASGDFVILLNNDTLVTPNWLDLLLEPFSKDGRIGLVGPITNSAGNEQMVAIPNLNEQNHVELSSQYIARNKGYFFESDKLGFYCVAVRGEAMRKVGMLDEKFGLGMFEDDDYCVRMRKAGYRMVVNEGCFIYHKGSLSFKKIVDKEYQEIFAKNRAYFVSKHGEDWLFNNLTMAFYRQMEREVRSLQASRPSPETERVVVRLNGFKYLIENAMALERKQSSSGNELRGTKERGRAWNMFVREYIKGDRRSRKLFMRKVRRHYRPLRNEDIVSTMGEVRRTEGLTKLIILAGGQDFWAKRNDYRQVAEALADSGLVVLYMTRNMTDDLVEVVEKVKPKLYVMNEQFIPFLQHMASPNERILGIIDPLPKSTQEAIAAANTVILDGNVVSPVTLKMFEKAE